MSRNRPNTYENDAPELSTTGGVAFGPSANSADACRFPDVYIHSPRVLPRYCAYLVAAIDPETMTIRWAGIFNTERVTGDLRLIQTTLAAMTGPTYDDARDSIIGAIESDPRMLRVKALLGQASQPPADCAE